MIPTNLAPGTEIVCIEPRRTAFDLPGYSFADDWIPLEKGKIYMVREYMINPELNMVTVLLNEIIRPIHNNLEYGYWLARFRLPIYGGLEAHWETKKELENV